MERTPDEHRPDGPHSDAPPPAESPLEPEPSTTAVPLEPSSEAGAPTSDRPVLYWQPPTPELGPDEAGWRGVGAIVGRTLDTYGSSFGLYLILGAPLAIFGATTVFVGANLVALIPIAVFTALVGVVTSAAMMFATDDVWRGVRPGIADVLDRAAGRAVALILSSLVVIVVLGAVVLVVGIAGVFVGVAATTGSGPGPVLVVLVLVAIALLVVASVVTLRWAVSGPAIALDGLGPIAGLRRSWALTRGHLWRLTRLYLALLLFTVMASTGASFLSTYAPERAFAAAGLALATLLTSPLLAISMAIAYRDLGGHPVVGGEGLPRRAGRVRSSIAVLGGGLILFAAGIWSVAGAGGQIFTPGRGQVIAGSTANPADPCHPGGVKTTFSAAEEIWIAAIFSRHLTAGQEAVVEYSRNTQVLGRAPLTAGADGLDCYYEIDPIIGGEPGSYRITVRLDSTVIADGAFTIR